MLVRDDVVNAMMMRDNVVNYASFAHDNVVETHGRASLRCVVRHYSIV